MRGATTCTDRGLINGTIYYYVVTAIDTSDNESVQSPEISATPEPIPTNETEFTDADPADSLISTPGNWDNGLPSISGDKAGLISAGDLARYSSGTNFAGQLLDVRTGGILQNSVTAEVLATGVVRVNGGTFVPVPA